MRIAQSAIDLFGQHSATRQVRQREELHVWVGRPGSEPGAAGARSGLRPAAVAELSDAALKLAGRAAKEAGAADATSETDPEDRLDADLLILMRLVEEMTGRRVRLADPATIGQDAPPPEPPPSGGLGVTYERLEERVAVEQVSFSASGTVRTEDGREFAFELDFEMTRVEVSVERFSLRAGSAARTVDPLVLNFADAVSRLSDRAFELDLDGDGEGDRVPVLGPGSSYLAWDQDGDGRIDDGSELFGPSTGDGFSELARQDADGNGFIDEADPVWEQLSLFNGSPGRLVPLGERGVGALYLGAASTPWDLTGADGELRGRLGQTGVWLGEEGGAGTMQHLDVVA